VSGVRRGGKTGVPTGSVEYSPDRLKRRRRARQRQEERWAARSGPFVISGVKDGEPPEADEEIEDPEDGE